MNPIQQVFKTPFYDTGYTQNISKDCTIWNLDFMAKEGWMVRDGDIACYANFTVAMEHIFNTNPLHVPRLFAVTKQVMNCLEKMTLKNQILTLQNFVDQQIATYKEKTCRKGCSFCCHQRVAVHEEEAKIISEKMNWVNKEQLEKLGAFEYEDDIWKGPTKERTCPFLKDSLCSIYEIRPISCRSLISRRDPKLCDENNGIEETEFLNDFNIAIAVQAFHNITRNDGTNKKWTHLPKAILELSKK